jgi:Holliday junction DNA helicase RuvA
MIAWLQGTLLSKHPTEVLINVGGVGYEVQAPLGTISELPEIGQQATLFIHQVIREDANQLYGFSNVTERSIFRALLKVNGVGAKVALAILSGMDGATFTRCVMSGDSASLVRLPGIGKKTAERLIIEMRDRLQDIGTDYPNVATSASTPPQHRSRRRSRQRPHRPRPQTPGSQPPSFCD